MLLSVTSPQNPPKFRGNEKQRTLSMYVRLELEISILNDYEGPHYAVSSSLGFLPLSPSLFQFQKLFLLNSKHFLSSFLSFLTCYWDGNIHQITENRFFERQPFSLPLNTVHVSTTNSSCTALFSAHFQSAVPCPWLVTKRGLEYNAGYMG